MEVKTPEEFFEKQLPVRFKPDKTAGIEAIIQLSLSGGQKDQDWVVVIKNKNCKLVKEPTLQQLYLLESLKATL